MSRSAMDTLTPMLRQYRSIKEQHPDAILLFRLGDFYEMFYDDALLASKALSLTLTSRGHGTPHIGASFLVPRPRDVRVRDSDVRRAVPRRGRLHIPSHPAGAPGRRVRPGRG